MHVDQHPYCFTDYQAREDTGALLVSRERTTDLDYFANVKVSDKIFNEAVSDVTLNNYVKGYRISNPKVEKASTVHQLKARFKDNPDYKSTTTTTSERLGRYPVLGLDFGSSERCQHAEEQSICPTPGRYWRTVQYYMFFG